MSSEMTQKLQAPDFPTLWKVVDRLERVGIDYMLTGSMAVNVYGHARATNDFDMVIQVGLGDVKNLSKLFEKDFYINEETVREAIRHESMFNIIDNETVFKDAGTIFGQTISRKMGGRKGHGREIKKAL